MKNIAKIAGILFTCFWFIGCKKFLDVGIPKNQLITESVFEDDNTATAALRGVYANLVSNTFVGDKGFNVLPLYSADEMMYFSPRIEYKQFENNSLQPDNSVNNGIWNDIYFNLFTVNSIIEGLEKSKGVTQKLKLNLLGEAKFLRAFFHFYLVNFYGDVPLVTTTNYEINTTSYRTPKEQVYTQIIKDLISASELIGGDYSNEGGKRIRPNKFAALSLLSRVYLYQRDWINAEMCASKVIESDLYSLVDLNSVFQGNSGEAIWQLYPIESSWETNEGVYFILSPQPNNEQGYLRSEFMGAIEPDDLRKQNWISSIEIFGNTMFYPFKYKNNNRIGTDPLEYTMVLRLAEIYLIRSEARLNINQLDGCKADINVIRKRAGLSNTIADTEIELLSAIQNERRIELFTEWGHRWLDLKRWPSNTQLSLTLADDVLKVVKPNMWSSFDILYPIPSKERNNNINLSQNDGY